MNIYEWNGSSLETRLSDGATLQDQDLVLWTDDWPHEDWRFIILSVLEKNPCPVDDEHKKLLVEAAAQFGDGINTGFYINSYTTKHCPTMEGVLEELRIGIQRLGEQRREEQQKLLQLQEPNDAEGLALKGKSPFAETMRTLTRLLSSYRRCY